MTRYVAIGDSTVEGLEDPGPDGVYVGWADRLAHHLRTVHPDLTYANLAVRGMTAREVRATQLGQALALEPDIAVVVAGVNDVLRPRFDREALRDDLLAMHAALNDAGARVAAFTMPDMAKVAPLAVVLRGRLDALNEIVLEAATLTLPSYSTIEEIKSGITARGGLVQEVVEPLVVAGHVVAEPLEDGLVLVAWVPPLLALELQDLEVGRLEDVLAVHRGDPHGVGAQDEGDRRAPGVGEIDRAREAQRHLIGDAGADGGDRAAEPDHLIAPDLTAEPSTAQTRATALGVAPEDGARYTDDPLTPSSLVAQRHAHARSPRSPPA